MHVCRHDRRRVPRRVPRQEDRDRRRASQARLGADTNDVDFQIQDSRGGHAFYSEPLLPSGGKLYADITTGYGPEYFAIHGKPRAGPYKLSINYYSQGPMGYGMGLLQIVKHDGKGSLEFQDRPYVIMNNEAYVNLGTFR